MIAGMLRPAAVPGRPAPTIAQKGLSMSEPTTHPSDAFPTWLTERGEDAYALVWVTEGSEPAWAETEAPRVGETGIAQTGVDTTRIEVREVTHGRQDTLRRWLQLEQGGGQLAIITSGPDGLREHTPGELAAHLTHDPGSDEAHLTDMLASWFHRRNAEAPQGLELGWIAAAAAWTCHMRALTSYPPPAVLAQSLERAGEHDEATASLVVDTGLKIAALLDRLERVNRPRTNLIEDWHTVEALVADVPALTETADWLLDQIALRDASAQQLRAVLEPDISDYLRDRRPAGSAPGTPALDAPRAAHLAQTRQTVRAYTAAAHSGREREAQQLFDAFIIPARALATSDPAATWRQHSATARDAVEVLAAQRAATTAQDGGADYLADPELLHAQASYLAAREGQLHLMHDALGRLAFPVPAPRDMPEEFAAILAAQTQRRVIEAFGTFDRAAQALGGQIRYQLQQPVPARRRTTVGAETALLTRARDALEHTTAADAPLDEEHIRARLREVMSRPAAPDRTGLAAPTAHSEAHTQALAAGATAPGVTR